MSYYFGIEDGGSKTDAVFAGMAEKLTPDLVKKVNAVFRWIVTDDKKAPVAQWSKYKMYIPWLHLFASIHRGELA